MRHRVQIKAAVEPIASKHDKLVSWRRQKHAVKRLTHDLAQCRSAAPHAWHPHCLTTHLVMKIGLIYARARNGAIGKNGVMPWHLPEDLAHFKRTTLNHPVIMGRRTWDSIPARFRPLPGRDNIVITRQEDWQENGAQRASSLREALQKCESSAQTWVIGGAQIYAQAMPLADELVVTEIDADFDGDAFAPTIGPEWQEVARVPFTSATGLSGAFVTWRRAVPAA